MKQFVRIKPTKTSRVVSDVNKAAKLLKQAWKIMDSLIGFKRG
jgi:hypothetical protein